MVCTKPQFGPSPMYIHILKHDQELCVTLTTLSLLEIEFFLLIGTQAQRHIEQVLGDGIEFFYFWMISKHERVYRGVPFSSSCIPFIEGRSRTLLLQFYYLTSTLFSLIWPLFIVIFSHRFFTLISQHSPFDGDMRW